MSLMVAFLLAWVVWFVFDMLAYWWFECRANKRYSEFTERFNKRHM